MAPTLSSSTSARQHKEQQAAVTYALFLHRQELQKRCSSMARKARTKFMLTHELVSRTIRNIQTSTADELRALSRESAFKATLYRDMTHRKQQQRKQLVRVQKQQKTKIQQRPRKPLQQHQQQQQHTQQQKHQQQAFQQQQRLMMQSQSAQRQHGNVFAGMSSPRKNS